MANFNFTFQPGTSLEQIVGFEMAGRIWSQYIQDDAVFDVHVMSTDELPASVIGGAIPALGTASISGVEFLLGQDATSDSDAIAVENLSTTSAPDGSTQYSTIFNDTEYQASDLTFTYANAKALGWQAPSDPNIVDGYIVFNDLDNSEYTWDYDFSRTAEASSQELDFLGMALHELGHVMGFTSGIDIISNAYEPTEIVKTSLFDLFRYSERSADKNAQELTIGEEAYFSIDGGETSLASLSAGRIENADGDVSGFQSSHWESELTTGDSATDDTASQANAFEFPVLSKILEFSVSPLSGAPASIVNGDTSVPGFSSGVFDPGTFASDVFNPFGQQVIVPVSDPSQLPESTGIMDEVVVPGVRSNISALDLLALDVIGYDISNVSPSSIDYTAVLQETENALVQEIGVGTSDLSEALQSSPLVRDMQANLANLYERRRSRGGSRRRPIFQSIDTAAASPNDSQTAEAESIPQASITQATDLNDVSSNLQESTLPAPEPEQPPSEPQSSNSQNNGLGSRDSSQLLEDMPVDQLISYGYEQPRTLNQNNLNQNQGSQFTTNTGLFGTGLSGLFGTGSENTDLLGPSYGMLASTRSVTTPVGGSVDNYGSSSSPWNQSITDALGIENIQATLASWLGG